MRTYYKNKETYHNRAKKFIKTFQSEDHGCARWSQIKNNFGDPTALNVLLDRLIKDKVNKKEAKISSKGPPEVWYSLMPHFDTLYPDFSYEQAVSMTTNEKMMAGETDKAMHFKINFYSLCMSILNCYLLTFKETSGEDLTVSKDRFELYFQSFVSQALIQGHESYIKNTSSLLQSFKKCVNSSPRNAVNSLTR